MLERIRKMQAEEGFTLVELLLVIVIIAILIAIVVFGIATFRTQAQNACTEANNRTVATATAAYRVNYPGTNPSTQDLQSKGYIESIPSC